MVVVGGKLPVTQLNKRRSEAPAREKPVIVNLISASSSLSASLVCVVSVSWVCVCVCVGEYGARNTANFRVLEVPLAKVVTMG